MEVALTFGAVGDFIAIGVLIKDIISALDDASGSAREYRDLIQHLSILEQILREIERIFSEPSQIHSLSGLRDLATRTIDQVKQSLAEFHAKTRKYSVSLASGGSGSTLRDTARKLQWKMEGRDVDKFRIEVVGYTASLQILLEATSLQLSQLAQSDLNGRLDDLSTQTHTVVREQGENLQQYLGRQIRSLMGRLSLVVQIGLSLKKSTDEILRLGIRLLGELQGLRGLVLRLERPFVDEAFVLEDAVGRALPMHFRTIVSWDALHFVLQEQFKGRKGERRVAQRMYALHDRATGRGIRMSTPWNRAFLPQQRIDMSLFCIEPDSQAVESDPEACPRCHATSLETSNNSTHCSTCGLQFRRIFDKHIGRIFPTSHTPSMAIQPVRSTATLVDDCESIWRRSLRRTPKREVDSIMLDEPNDETDNDADGDFKCFAHVLFSPKKWRLIDIDRHPTPDASLVGYEASQLKRNTQDDKYTLARTQEFDDYTKKWAMSLFWEQDYTHDQVDLGRKYVITRINEHISLLFREQVKEMQ